MLQRFQNIPLGSKTGSRLMSTAEGNAEYFDRNAALKLNMDGPPHTTLGGIVAKLGFDRQGPQSAARHR
jgi:hypothetical protein